MAKGCKKRIVVPLWDRFLQKSFYRRIFADVFNRVLKIIIMKNDMQSTVFKNMYGLNCRSIGRQESGFYC